MNGPHRPWVGVAVFIFNAKGEILTGLRMGSLGTGTWGLPGGHLEYKESFASCAEREIMEECNLQIKNVKFLTATNDFHQPQMGHGVTVFMTAQKKDENARAERCEPEKCQAWRWQMFQDIVDNHEKIKKGVQVQEQYFVPLYNIQNQTPEAVKTLLEYET